MEIRVLFFRTALSVESLLDRPVGPDSRLTGRVRSVCRRSVADMTVGQAGTCPHPGAPAIKSASTTSPVRLQFGVLLCCQAQEHPASANLDRLVQRLPALQVRQATASLNQLDDLIR